MNTRLCRIIILLVCCWTMSTPVWASYSKGLDAYREGEYPKAYKILTAVAKKTKNKEDKANAIVLMAAAAAKMGKKGKAKALFTKALKLDSTASLSKDVEKDKAVLKIFAKAKKSEDSEEEEDTDDIKSEKSSGGRKTASVGAKAFIPFGIGFFMAGKSVKGLLYGGLQAGAAVGFLFFGNEITKANADAEAVGSQIIADQAAGIAPDPEKLAFLDQNEAFVKSAQGSQTAVIGLGVLGYSIGVIDGLVFGGGGKSRSSIQQKESLNRSMAASDKWIKSDSTESARDWELKLIPVPSRYGPGAVITLDHNF